MTSRERLTAVFENRTPDRIPIWLMFPFQSEPFAADVYNLECYAPVIPTLREHTDFIERNAVQLDPVFNHPEVRKRKDEQRRGNNIIQREIVEYGDSCFESSLAVEGGSRKRSFYLKDIDELDKLMNLPWETPKAVLEPYISRSKELGHNGVSGVTLVDPISAFHRLCSETEFTLWCYTHTAKVKAFLDLVLERVMAIYTQFLEAGVGYGFWITGPEFLGPPAAPRRIFHTLITPHERRLIDLVRSYGKKTFLHCHGRIREILPEIDEIGPDGLHPIEPPMGDCSLRQAREALGPDMVLVGNVQYSDLAMIRAGLQYGAGRRVTRVS